MKLENQGKGRCVQEEEVLGAKKKRKKRKEKKRGNKCQYQTSVQNKSP